LQAQLAAIESQISALSRHKGPDGTPDPGVATLETAARTIEGAMATAASELAALMMKQGQTSGGLVNEQA
jgi:hypothetical protein